MLLGDHCGKSITGVLELSHDATVATAEGARANGRDQNRGNDVKLAPGLF